MEKKSFCLCFCIIISSLAPSNISQNDAKVLEKQQQLLVQQKEATKSRWAEHAAQKARKEAETKAREEAEKRRVAEEKKKKKRTLEYLQQLQDKVLEEDTEGSQIMRPKCKEVLLENDADCWPSKKAKEKQLARYQGDIGIKMGDANLCEKCVHTGQDCLVHNSR